MSEPLYATRALEHSPGACLPVVLSTPFVAAGLFCLMMAVAEARGAERLVFAGFAAVGFAVPFGVRRLIRPGVNPTRLLLATDGTVTVRLRGGDVVLPPQRLARVVTGSVTTSTHGARSSRRVVAFVDPDGEQLAQVGRWNFADADLGGFFAALTTARPDVVLEHR